MNNFKYRVKNQESRAKNFDTKILIILILFVHFFICNLKAQNTNDSLSLNQLIKQIVENHPLVKEAEESLNIADAKIGLARAGFLPNIDVAGTYTRIGPVPSINFGGHDLQMAPANNVSSVVEYEQTLFDFGKTKLDVNLANENKELSKLSIEQLKQKMSISAIANFYILLYIQDAIEIKNEELRTLNLHLDYIKKKSETGSATQYEIISTQVRISNIESQKIDLETGRKVQSSILCSFLGQNGRFDIKVKKNLEVKIPEVLSDSLISFAYAHRDEMKLAREKSTIVEMQYKVSHAQDNPSVSLFASGGYKNGYFDPNLYNPGQNFKLNYVAGVGIKVPLFYANRKKNNLLISKSNIQDCNYDVDIASRNIYTEVVQADADVSASDKKIKQFELQLSQAEKALSLAEINYKAGVITNLDLLDATTIVSESRLLLLKSRIDYMASVYKLKNAIGDRLY